MKQNLKKYVEKKLKVSQKWDAFTVDFDKVYSYTFKNKGIRWLLDNHLVQESELIISDSSIYSYDKIYYSYIRLKVFGEWYSLPLPKKVAKDFFNLWDEELAHKYGFSKISYK